VRQIAYLDFDLDVDGHAGAYEAHVRSSPVGESRAPVAVTLPPELRLERFTSGAVPTLARAELETFGEGLFGALFGSELRTLLVRSLDRSADKGLGLRIRLRLCDDLATLPWEYLWDPDEGDFLALSHRTPIVRYTELAQPVEPLQVEPPLRILVVIADPTDLPRLDVDREWARLTEALSGLRDRGKVTIERLEEPTMSALQRTLRQGEHHVFHFVGHGGFDPSTSEGMLAFEDGTGLRKLVGAQLLGTWLNDSPSLRLAVLNACEGARTAAQNPFAGVAQRLLRRGIPAVIAMQFEISDGAALAFSRAFYESMADGYPIDASVAEARKTVLEMSAIEWGTPVLYMRAEDGRVFDLGAAETAAPQPERAEPAPLPPPPSPAEAMTPPPAPGPAQPLEGSPNLVGRWRVQDADGSVAVLDLFPNGMFQGVGRIVTMEFTGDVQLAGQWGFEPASRLLQLQGLVNGMLPFAIAGAIQGRQGDVYVGIDQEGETFTLTPA
jgi:hypothetical protein